MEDGIWKIVICAINFLRTDFCLNVVGLIELRDTVFNF